MPLSCDEFEGLRHRLATALLCKRIRYHSEKGLQTIMEERLKTVAPDIVREFVLSKRDRPDFFWESTGIVIEAKVDRSDSKVFRQVVRYTEHEKVTGVILFRHRPLDIPALLNGKHVANIEFWKLML